MKLDVDHARRPWEARLAREGLAPLDVGGQVRTRFHTETRVPTEEAEAREVYLGWALDVLGDSRNFFGGHSDAQVTARDCWKLHAQGQSNAQIATSLETSRARVEQALRFVRALAGDPPVVNPWRQSGRDAAKTERPRPRGENMADDKTKPVGTAWTRYGLITLMPNAMVRVGGRDTCEFIDRDARITPLGMQVKIPDAGYAPLLDADGKKNMSLRNRPIEGATLILDIPAWKIVQAERVEDGR